jgi:hypothetical protein
MFPECSWMFPDPWIWCRWWPQVGCTCVRAPVI